MLLYLVRHGQAADKEDDPSRSLTFPGRRDVERIAAFLEPLGVHVHTVQHSGKRRAEQTAEILAESLKIGEEMAARDDLGPNAPVQPLRDELNGSEEDRMLVGHLPFLDKLASLLVAGDQDAHLIGFAEASIACIEQYEVGSWRVRWLVCPPILGSQRGRAKQ